MTTYEVTMTPEARDILSRAQQEQQQDAEMVPKAQFDALQARFDDLAERFRNATDRHTEWRDRVRDAIIGYATDEGLCVEGTNEFLDNLGLDRMETEYQVTWTESYTVEIERTGTVTAGSPDDAEEAVKDDPDSAESSDNIGELIAERVRFGDYEPDDSDEIRIVGVEQA